MTPFKKLKRRAQHSGGAYGHQHVDKWLRRKANRFIRRFMREEVEEYVELLDPMFEYDPEDAVFGNDAFEDYMDSWQAWDDFNYPSRDEWEEQAREREDWETFADDDDDYRDDDYDFDIYDRIT